MVELHEYVPLEAGQLGVCGVQVAETVGAPDGALEDVEFVTTTEDETEAEAPAAADEDALPATGATGPLELAPAAELEAGAALLVLLELEAADALPAKRAPQTPLLEAAANSCCFI